MNTNLPAIVDQIQAREHDFELALAGDAAASKFVRSILLAIEKEPKLRQCNPLSVLDACNRAASDGLLLDGREAALVVYNTRENGLVAQYLPMYLGLLKRVYRSGMVSTVEDGVVYEKEIPERFRIISGTEKRIEHEPILMGERGQPAIVYAVATMRDGTKASDWMTVAECVKIAKRQRKNVDADGKLKGIWRSDFTQMCKKTVLKRLARLLPQDARMASVMTADETGEDDMEPFAEPSSEFTGGDESTELPETRPAGRKAAGTAAARLNGRQRVKQEPEPRQEPVSSKDGGEQYVGETYEGGETEEGRDVI